MSAPLPILVDQALRASGQAKWRRLKNSLLGLLDGDLVCEHLANTACNHEKISWCVMYLVGQQLLALLRELSFP
jgi:hypothetical protein